MVYKLTKFKKIFLTMLVVTIIISQTSCGKKQEAVTKTGFFLDTSCSVSIYEMKNGLDETKANQIIDDVFKLCLEYENLLSKTIPASDIYKLNHSNGAKVKVDPQTAALIKRGIMYGNDSDGLFDITIGKATALWNFHKDAEPRIPTKAELDDAVKHIDYRGIVFYGNEVMLKDKESEIDLGGIAKGFIADKMADYLKDHGVTGAIINLGGNVYVVGAKDGKDEPFKVGVRVPMENSTKIIGGVSAINQTIVTSGSYEREFVKDGVRYHHILDPKTGYPVNSGLRSVTIIGPADTSRDCDAMATICFMLGKDKGLEFIERHKDYAAIFIDDDFNITLSSRVKGFKRS